MTASNLSQTARLALGLEQHEDVALAHRTLVSGCRVSNFGFRPVTRAVNLVWCQLNRVHHVSFVASSKIAKPIPFARGLRNNVKVLLPRADLEEVSKHHP